MSGLVYKYKKDLILLDTGFISHMVVPLENGGTNMEADSLLKTDNTPEHRYALLAACYLVLEERGFDVLYISGLPTVVEITQMIMDGKL